MTLGQNLHMLPSNCVIVSTSPSPALMQHHQGKRPIAPAPEHRTNVLMPHDQNRCAGKKKMTFTHLSPYGTQPASVQRRNARERNRVKQVNNGFANLRQHIPPDVITALTNGGRGASKKLSKVDTLKLAVEYIRRLQELLDDSDSDMLSTSSAHTSHHHNSSASSYYSTSPMQHSPMEHSSMEHSPLQHSTPAPCSEASTSPTPSYSSDVSSGNGYVHPHPQQSFKYEVYDAYNPEDEELLDCITWWQQQ